MTELLLIVNVRSLTVLVVNCSPFVEGMTMLAFSPHVVVIEYFNTCKILVCEKVKIGDTDKLLLEVFTFIFILIIFVVMQLSVNVLLIRVGKPL